MTISGLHCEYIIVSGSNDKFALNDSLAAVHTCTIESGIYRDGVALAEAIDDAITNSSYNEQSIRVQMDPATGRFNFFGFDSIVFDIYFTGLIVPPYDLTLANSIGFDGDVTGAYDYTSDNVSPGSFVPSEPVELDDRPDELLSDMFALDVYQSESRSGNVAFTGGRQKIYTREIQLLLANSDLESFAEFCEVAGQGRKIAFYHDAENDKDWPGDNGNYKQYWWFGGEDGVGFLPSRVEEVNKAWHRQGLTLRQVVD